MKVDMGILTANLEEEAKAVIDCFRERYGQEPRHIDEIQESKCFEYAAHEYEEHLYAKVKEMMESKYVIEKGEEIYYVQIRKKEEPIMAFYITDEYDAKAMAEKFCKLLNEGRLDE